MKSTNISLFKSNLKKAIRINSLVWYFLICGVWLSNAVYLITKRSSFGDIGEFLRQIALVPLFVLISVLLSNPRRFLDYISEKILTRNVSPEFRDPNAALFMVSAAALFAELMIIRIHSSYFPVFAFYKNISLLSCFLGLGIGFVKISSAFKPAGLVFPLMILQIIFLDSVSASPMKLALLNPIPEYTTMGVAGINNADYAILIYFFITFIFALNTLCFVPLGQLMGSLMDKGNRLVNYGWNLTGSIFGILIFSALSFLATPPQIWIMVFALFIFLLVKKSNFDLILTGVLLIAILLFTTKTAVNTVDLYSPYQNLKISFEKDRTVVEANQTYFQNIMDLGPESIKNNKEFSTWAGLYNFPYTLVSDPEEVLIVGSGTGNDVAAAIRNNAKNINAVEIDPLIVKIGKSLHPEYPYKSPGVRIFEEDARTFIRRSENKYDIIVFGLLDSHSLLSGQSSIRLDSFVYTVEAFKEAKNKLKDGGILVLSFARGNEKVGKKLSLMLTEAFNGKKPDVFENFGITLVAGENLKKDYKLPPGFKESTDYYEKSEVRVDKATDDWPFIYMPRRNLPVSIFALATLLLIVSLILIKNFSAGMITGFHLRSFLLGAGFMLIETKAVTQLALYYGTTWFVNSLVILAILLFGFVANLVTLRFKRISKKLIYGLILASVALGFLIFKLNYFSLSDNVGRISVILLLTLPVFFSGMAFSSEIKESKSIKVLLYSNIIGAMVGGILEYSSMVFGFKFLYLVAFLIYLFAFPL